MQVITAGRVFIHRESLRGAGFLQSRVTHGPPAKGRAEGVGSSLKFRVQG